MPTSKTDRSTPHPLRDSKYFATSTPIACERDSRRQAPVCPALPHTHRSSVRFQPQSALAYAAHAQECRGWRARSRSKTVRARMSASLRCWRTLPLCHPLPAVPHCLSRVYSLCASAAHCFGHSRSIYSRTMTTAFKIRHRYQQQQQWIAPRALPASARVRACARACVLCAPLLHPQPKRRQRRGGAVSTRAYARMRA